MLNCEKVTLKKSSKFNIKVVFKTELRSKHVKLYQDFPPTATVDGAIKILTIWHVDTAHVLSDFYLHAIPGEGGGGG